MIRKPIRVYSRTKFLIKHRWLADKAFIKFDKSKKAFISFHRYLYKTEISEALKELLRLAHYELGYSDNYCDIDLASSLNGVWVDMTKKED